MPPVTRQPQVHQCRLPWFFQHPPDPAIYTPVLAMLGTRPEETLAVGDALRTDIAGAKSRNIPSCWVLGGIHEAELGGDPARIEAAAAAAGLAPVAVLPRFVW